MIRTTILIRYSKIKKYWLKIKNIIYDIPPDVQFDKSFKILQLEIPKILKHRRSELTKGLQSKSRDPKYQGDTARYLLRFRAQDKFIDDISNDFIQVFKIIVLKNCEDIHKEKEKHLKLYLNDIFNILTEEAIRGEKAFAHSIGQSSELDAYITPVKGKFAAADSNCREEIETLIVTHNLEYEKKKNQERKEIRKDIKRKIIVRVVVTIFVAFILYILNLFVKII